MANNNRGSIVRQGNFLRINNARVEDVSFTTRNTGYIIISYSSLTPNGLTSIEQLQLNVNNNTFILGRSGLPVCFCDIRQGMWIDVTFSSAMTRSIPPQANAFMIIVRRTPQNTPSQNFPPQNFPFPAKTTTARIIRVDAGNNQLYTGAPGNLNSQTRFVVTNSTLIQNRNGLPIPLRSLHPGQTVRITHANFQTASIPPQTTAYRIQVL